MFQMLQINWMKIDTVPVFNSCTKCPGSPGIIHDRTPDDHPVPWT